MNIKTISLTIFLCFSCLGCSNKRNPDASMQPYEGYPLLGSVEEVKEHLRGRCIDTIQFKAGDIIADVGAGNGNIEAMLSVFHDSLTFYVQDIDSAVCNRKAVDEVAAFYRRVRGAPVNDRFIVVTGSDTATNLPDNTFDKILMIWTYQYFKYPGLIMKDLRKKLKDDGLIYIVNPNIDYESGRKLNADYGWNGSPLEKQISDILACGFELAMISRNNYCCSEPYIMVFRKKFNK